MPDPEHQKYRRPEPAFARAVAAALGPARTVLEVAAASAGGSYVPTDREVTSIRPGHADPAGPDGAFDAAVVAFALPEWDDPERALAGLRRATRGPIVLLTRDPEQVGRSWLAEYAPEVTAADALRHPSLGRIAAALGGDTVTTTPLPVPFTCIDGFSEAYYARPERLLDPAARRADPAWGLVDEFTARRSVAALRSAIETGEWDRRHGALRVRPSSVGSVVLVTATPGDVIAEGVAERSFHP